MEFRERLLATLRAIEPVLAEEGVVVIGSEVPNLLEENAASTLVVSLDVDIGVAVEHHGRVKAALARIVGLAPSPEEPSVWIPVDPTLLEVNFVGIDAALRDPMANYVYSDSELPLLVFGALSFVHVGRYVEVEGLRVPVPSAAGLILEKLFTDRSGEKGDRDLLVVLGLLVVASPSDLEEVVRVARSLEPPMRELIRSNLTLLSLLDRREGMPDPTLHRAKTQALLARISE